MQKQGRFIQYVFIIGLLVAVLSGCLNGLWTGANLVYDRHNVYKKLSDYRLTLEVNSALYSDKLLKTDKCVLDLAVFNGDILLVGHVPTQEYLDEIHKRLKVVTGYRRFFDKILVNSEPSTTIEDSWITTKIRSQIFADDTVDPKAFKIITSSRVVYIMGDVHPEEAEKVVKIARLTNGVERVVKILKYFTYQERQTKVNEAQ